ncbi:uncharacterized protein LOC123714289 [Pieris brassicae]|uniref:RING-type E3 ubiquitin transferase BRCA1 n=1 Tax=Pieris brassicae TaxID=7116 RepID=A0A9P0SZ74_PIEBR|nr:uncharacterized protein LOC123714289 [Pieris brassicae]CAH3959000.1 unnamed protein product [Pieris brassicae]
MDCDHTTDIVLKEKYSNLISKIIETNVYYVTCLECCKYYVVPTTASCGHSLCHTCWYGRQTCPNCRIKIDRKSLKLNMVLQNLTEHIHNLKDASKDIFGPTTDYIMSCMDNGLLQDPTKNVNEWLTSSQNHFSAPVTTPESIPELTIPPKILDKDIQFHQENKITTKAVLIDQNDWDKIEELPESEDILNKDKENIIGPMDIEQLEIIDGYEEYSTDNPRRSSRNKDILLSNEKNTASSLTKIIKNKNTNNWTTVKNMKHEFSKLNKQAKNKLDVSVEIAKAIQNCKKTILPLENSSKISDVDIVSSLTGNENMIKNTVHVHFENITNNQSDEYTIENRKENCKLTTDSSKNLISLGSSKRNNQIYLSKTIEEKDKSSNSHDNNRSKNNVTFFKRSPWSSKIGLKVEDNENLKNETSEIVNTDDIEITIKIGKTIANICIKKKDNNVNVKVNSEREIQSSISHNNVNKISVSTSPFKDNSQEKRKTELVNKSIQAFDEIDSVKKKNTASADTSSLNTDKKTIERHLSSINEVEEIKNTNNSCPEMVQPKLNKYPKDCLNDFDMFDSESVKDCNIQPLSRSVHTPSAIFMPSNVSKLKSQIKSNKRERDESETDVPNKKGKLTPTMSGKRNLITLNESEPGDYNEILDQVFANIKADMKGGKATDSENKISNTQKIPITSSQTLNKFQIKNNIKEKPTQKCSENIFSLLEHELELDISQGNHKSIDIKKTKSKEIAEKINTQLQSTDNDMDIDPSTPQNDDSDKSVVEDTPQKDISHKSKQMDSIKSRRESKKHESVVNIDETEDTKVTIIENNRSIETPASMYKFVNNLHHKSTPMAKKSLDFNYTEQMCPINTQEREIISKAFEQIKPENKIKKYCLVVSCLPPPDVARVKLLCTQRKWTFVDKFTPDVTHLIVSVTDDNRAQRSVKFICALAASKWILSMEWIHKCINSKEVVNEEPHEVLDITGEPGPRRSRLARQKLFTGIKFYCMPPFGVLDIETLKEILVFAGGEVVNEIKDVKATDAPSLLLAEPESTQENRFIELAVHLSVVPVNYEWVLNSLGYYTLDTIVDLLLCPDSLLPQVIMKWPRALISSQDSIDD